MITNRATEALAHWVADASTPAHTFPLLRECVLDFVGLAAFAGHFVESSASLQALRALAGSGGDATVIGSTVPCCIPFAALFNGAHAHTLDFDDTNVAGGIHPGAPVIAAALAQAERLGSSGRDFLAALAVGYEVACRVGAACTAAAYDRGFHLTSVAGIFGAVAAAARLAGDDPTVVDAAFGLAGSRAAGSMQYLANGAWNKRYHPGFAAHDALLVLAIAQAGGRGAAEAVEGRYGILHAYTDRAEPERLLAGLGSEWLMLGTAIKPYPSCRLTHGAIDAALALRGRQADWSSATIELRVSPTARKIVGLDEPRKIAPANIVDAQFSIFFQTAIALIDGRPGWGSYDRIGAPDVTALARRITVVEDGSIFGPACAMTVMASGQRFEEKVVSPLGEADRPLRRADVEAKFTDLARPVFGNEHTARIVGIVADLERAESVTAVARAFRTNEGE